MTEEKDRAAPDVKRVIAGLEYCMGGCQVSCFDCPYREIGQPPPDCLDNCGILEDAVELLKKSSTVEYALEVLRAHGWKENDDPLREIVYRWISIDERMPVETQSMFWRFSGTDKWSNAMWREQSDKVLVTVAFKDGSRRVTTGETHDGKWRTSISPTIEQTVTHWMPMPDLPPKHMT